MKARSTSTQTYTCTGAIQVPFAWDESKGNTHPCWAWRLGGHQALNIYDAIEQSCDVFFYNVGAPRQPLDESKSDYLHYRDKNIAGQHPGREALFRGSRHRPDQEEPHRAVLVRYQQQGSNCRARPAVLVPDPEWLARTYQGAGWSVSATINVSIGQGYFLTTPLQLALNTAALANDGKILQAATRAPDIRG